jgi:hypothetical protein
MGEQQLIFTKLSAVIYLDGSGLTRLTYQSFKLCKKCRKEANRLLLIFFIMADRFLILRRPFKMSFLADRTNFEGGDDPYYVGYTDNVSSTYYSRDNVPLSL